MIRLSTVFINQGFWHNTESAYDQQGGYLI
nr:MAG TPA: hypothetical protein [Caudoviricetes sp.]DAJ36474.1 MAG TPA: hypothetical protein [Inoviridae sp.]DAI90477.1 MAG TPA: hypothetical protein [Caudoviricetes sp.]DAK89230.1 MAG TPA: hypothetical protein [Caudoviricetes sp.]DAM18026.1 MAG TPA: hypothetical protein [Caudoviricetes sp.]